MTDWRFMGLDPGEVLAVVVAVLVLGAVLRYLFVERPRDTP